MQERERARLQKMGTSGVQTDTLLQSRKKRSSFTLPSFRRSSAGERQELAKSEQEMAKSAEEAARVQKAAAWQWYTRGVGEAVVPTKRPTVCKSLPSQAPILVDGRAASRFKAEARPTIRSAAAPAPSAGPATPLYDEFELFGLRTQMADFVQRLQLRQQTKGNQQFPAQNSKPPHIAAVDGAAASVSSHHQHIKAPPTAAAAISASNIHQRTKPASPFHMRPFSALHKLFRKVVSRSITNNSPLTSTSSPAVYIEPEVLSEEEEENSQYHYHHYIHHHHHHYHYGESPEERDAIIRSRRRHSESSHIRPHIPNPWEAESIEEEEEGERRSPVEAYLARRRRHSDTFATRLTPKKAAFDEEEETKEESAKAASPLQMPRRYNSERFSPNKCSAMENKDGKSGGGRYEYFLEIRRRRRSAEYNREAVGGQKNGGGTYKLSGAGDGAMPAKPLVWRRHSEGLQRPEGVDYEMGKRKPSPLARYLEDMLERQIGASAIANAAPARTSRDLPHH